MKFSSKRQTEAQQPLRTMALSGTCWLLLSLSWAACLGSCRRAREDGALPELFIFNELCALKDEPGPCKAIKDRYFFNVDAGRCEVFEYGGCGGNANNFETLEACEETCVVSDDKDPCHLAEAPGPCRGLVMRYFFDSRSQQCKQFFYGGCFGNANNFRSMEECQAKCQSPAKRTQAPEVQTHSARRLNVVLPTIMTGEMTVSEPQVQTNVTIPKDVKTEPCFSPIERGTCHGAERRFAFNHRTKRCQVFQYSGCGGNENNFAHRKDCIMKCIRSRKASGKKKMIRIRKKNIDNIVHRSGFRLY